MAAPRNGQVIWAAFFAAVLFGGFNAIGVRFTVMELPPFWGAVLRFGPAALLLLMYALIFKLPFPKGRSLFGAVLFGLFNFGISYIFLYWGIRNVQAGMAQVILALGPLLTLLLAILHRQERFHWRAFLGTIISAGGVALVFFDRTSIQVPILSVFAVFLGAVCLSEGGVIIRAYPKSDPITTNMVAMAVGAGLQFIASIFSGEPHPLPMLPATWASLGYLIVFGSCALFFLVVYVLQRWQASRAAYMLVLMPFITLPASALLDQEQIGLIYLSGVVLVLLGVYLGALAPRQKALAVNE